MTETATADIRVVIADDHSIMRDGLQRLLEGAGGIAVVGLAADGGEAVDQALAQHADVVLMDLSMPDVDGIAATRRIVSSAPDTAVVVLTSFSERERVIDAIDAGAVGYLLKDSNPDEIVRGVRAAAAGESPLDPKVARTLLSARSTRQDASLTTREREVLSQIARGLPNKRIARELGISEKTVKAHVTRIFAALNVTDRTQAALWAQRNGIG